MSVITFPGLETELDAVNTMLSVIGEAPLPPGTDLGGVTQSDVLIAINILREGLRSVLSESWQFNTEYGYEVAPVATNYPWIDSAGITTLLNVFLPPDGALRLSITKSSSQSDVDAIVRFPRRWPVGTPGGIATVSSQAFVICDRRHNRDGFDQTRYPFLYVDPVWQMDFGTLPQEARTYIVIMAARRLAARAVGSQTLVSFTHADEIAALRQLKNAYGQPDNYNIFNNSGMSSYFGGRIRHSTGVVDPRLNPGPNF